MPFVRFLSLLLIASPALAGLLPSNQPYTFTGGFVIGEAENYHAKSPSAVDQGWREIPTQAVVPAGVTYDNPSGGLAMQVPNVNGTNAVNYADGPFIDYYINIPGPGTYQLFLAWDGYDTASDSIYAGFTGGSGITPSTWYQDGGHVTSNFPQQGWDGAGEVGANNGSPAQNPMNFTFLSGGNFTLRIVAREDGVALDRFRIQLASMPDPNPVVALGQNILIGSDTFTYANGSIAGRNGGVNWDFDNQDGDGFVGLRREGSSTWDSVFGTPNIAANELSTMDSAAKREFGFPNEGDGAVSETGGIRYKQVYYRVKMRRAAGATWGGVSMYDFNTERIFFGVDFNPPTVGGPRHFAIGQGGVTYTSIPAVDATDYVIVAKIDYQNDKLSLWVNPDLTQPEGAPNATRPWQSDNWNTALRLGSGGSGATTWDDLAVGTSWGAIQAAYPISTPVSGADVIIAREDFDYDNGNVVGHSSGFGWDFDNSTTNNAFIGRTQTPSNWDNVEGWPYVFSKRLTTWNSSAKREFETPEADGSFSNAAASNYKVVYYRFEMQRSADNVSWSGLSLYDGNNERLMFGVPFAQNPANNRRELGIHNLGANQWNYTGIAPVAGTKYQIIAKVDYTTGFASLYVNPSLTGGEPGSPNATLAFTNAHSALRFGSGGDSPTYWDKLIVGTSWNAVVTPTYPAPATLSGNDIVIGTETFTYSGGPIALQQGGTGWDFQNTFGPVDSNEPSAWSHEFNSPYIINNTLRTWNAGAMRTFNGIEADGAINDADTSAAKAVYVRYEMQRDAGVSWGGMSLYDFGTERFLFGVPFATNPTSGVREFAIHDLASGHTYSGIVPVAGTNYTIVAKLDFVANKAVLWVNPDLTQPESANTIAAERTYTGTNWITAVRLASSADGDTQWDNLAVTTSWRSLQSALGAPTAFPDAITMRHTKKALLDVRQNDAGVGSVVIVTPPSSGTASVDSSGRIFYEHTTGTPASDSLTYKLVGTNGESAPTTVTYTFTSALRIANTTSTVPLLPPTTGLAVVDSTPGLNFTAPSCMTHVPGNPNKVLVGQRNGQIWLIDNIHSTTPNRTLFMTLPVYDDGNEMGLKGIALHPQFATNRQFFITYNLRISNADFARVSRFTAVNGNLDLGDVASEQPFISIPNPSSIHNIDTCRFGPDGYLYWSAGDAGGLNDSNNFAQFIDKSFWGGIFRIDVDRLPANVEPNPHSGIVMNGANAFYKVPANNPFIGATSFNGLALTGTLRTEIFAIGFRNPWQFSWDTQNGEMWAADVGLDSWEEVDVVTPGGNFGWSYLEGTANGTRTNPPGGFAPVAPLWTYFHGGGALDGRSECLACHTPQGGNGLSFETRQLNRTGTLGGQTGNFLELMANAGYFSNAPTQFNTLPKYHTPTDTSATLETRARSWLAVNCSYCHQTGGTGIGAFDMRPELSLTQTTMIDAHVGNVQAGDHKALVRGFNDKSVIWNRLSASGGYTRMPPLATAVIDPEGTQVVMDWINSMASRQTYA
ncbi:MAG: PQQ-dependent sugar dehydrogenase, partial [Prosthecobacter sp.]